MGTIVSNIEIEIKADCYLIPAPARSYEQLFGTTSNDVGKFLTCICSYNNLPQRMLDEQPLVQLQWLSNDPDISDHDNPVIDGIIVNLSGTHDKLRPLMNSEGKIDFKLPYLRYMPYPIIKSMTEESVFVYNVPLHLEEGLRVILKLRTMCTQRHSPWTAAESFEDALKFVMKDWVDAHTYNGCGGRICPFG